MKKSLRINVEGQFDGKAIDVRMGFLFVLKILFSIIFPEADLGVMLIAVIFFFHYSLQLSWVYQ